MAAMITFRDLPYEEKTELYAETCSLGHLHREQRTTLNKRMVPFLSKLAAAEPGAWLSLRRLDLDAPHYTDGLKTKRWGLTESQGRQSGEWRLTPLGRAFVTGTLEEIPSTAVSWENEVRRYTGKFMTFAELCRRYESGDETYGQQCDDIARAKEIAQ